MRPEDSHNLPLDRAACYAALATHDPRFDGRFFCGVYSTRIYCRPICRVKLPGEANCTFFLSAAAAETAGYRPCLKCRPELAPGLAPADSVARLASLAARAMEEDCLADRTLAELAAKLGISDRHLRRVFFSQYGVSPVQFLQTRRLLLAKSILTDTTLAVTDTAMAAGFGSLRRFNDLFKKRYRLAPGSFRKQVATTSPGNDAITLLLAYRPPYAWDQLLAFLSGRAIAGVEWVRDGSYLRTVAIARGDTVHRGWICVSHLPKRNALSTTIAASLLPVLPRVLARVRHLFDLNCDPYAVQEKLVTMDAISPDIRVPGIRLPGCFDSFEMCTRAVLGQLITVKAAGTLAARLAEALGEPLVTPFPELCRTFPSAGSICSLPAPLENRLGPLGIISAKARSIAALARALDSEAIILTPHGDAEAQTKKLLELPGFGPWTVNYIAMRALGWPDAFPSSDYGVKKALGGMPEKNALALATKWSPWRSYATVTLWESLKNVKTGSRQE